MSKDSVLQLKYLGLFPQAGFIEYGFRIENRDKSARQIVLTIADDFFLKNELKRQEAPDLCYQKLLTDLSAEDGDTDLLLSNTSVTASVTALDVAHYRDLHPNSKLRKSARRDAL
jgi:hypothetical protein